ncbi:MAG: hypothetical protein ACT4QC_02920 [Planctomycetaceae bacterium]
MHCSLRTVVSTLFTLTGVLAAQAFAAELPARVKSVPCAKAPKIDGKIDDDWKDAAPVDFDMTFVKPTTQTFSTKRCQLRVMNSANGLYIALRVPDEKDNRSFDPVEFDIAVLSFCRGDELQVGDDRKIIGPGFYVDKHITKPEQPNENDEDDASRDGKGAMWYDTEAKAWTVEWALPLGATDKEDIQVKPGDSVRFNVAFIDAFMAEAKDTQLGLAYGSFERAGGWGKLELAADVKDDGGSLFKQ